MEKKIKVNAFEEGEVGKQWFEGNDWQLFNKNRKMLESHYKQQKQIKLLHHSKVKIRKSDLIWPKTIQLAEFLFGSSPNNIESELKVPDDVNSILNKLESRHESIMYILSNGIFSKRLSTKYLETLLKPIRYEAAHSVLNSRNEHVIGF